MAKKSKKSKKSKIDIDTETYALFQDNMTTGYQLIGGTVDSSQKDFAVLKRNKIFSNGFGKIEKGYTEVQQSLNNYVSILTDYYEELGTTEKKYVSEVQTIAVPRSFKLNDVIFESTNKTIDLKKSDGKSVVDGNDTILESELNTSTGIIKEAVFDQTKEEVKKSYYDDSSIVTKADLIDATNMMELRDNVYDDYYTINGLKLADITGESLKDIAIDDVYTVQEVDLKNVDAFRNVIKENSGDKVEYSLIGKSNLEKINKEGAAS